jgi:hypothetical protein
LPLEKLATILNETSDLTIAGDLIIFERKASNYKSRYAYLGQPKFSDCWRKRTSSVAGCSFYREDGAF